MRVYLEKFLNEFEYPDEAQTVILSGYDYLKSQKDLADFFDSSFKAYENGYFNWDEELKILEELTKERDVHTYTLNLIFFICMTKHARVLYEEKELPYSLFKDTFMDLRYKLVETKNRYGVWGTSCYLAWYIWFYTLERFALGRLQFEIKPFRGTRPYTAHGVTINPEEDCLNIHIPSSGPLTPSSVEDSFKRAYEFYKGRFKGDYIPIMCMSWLLFTEHYNMLDKNSNIIQFMKRFDMLFTEHFSSYGIPFMVLYNRTFNGDINSYEPDNSLKRGYIELVKQERPCGTTCGVTLYKPEK